MSGQELGSQGAKKRAWVKPSFGEDKEEPKPKGSVKRKVPRKAKEVNLKRFKGDAKEVLWIDKYQPHDRDTLAVHKKKVSEVEECLNSCSEVPNVCKPSIIVLTGPSGVGKTATVRVLAEELKIEIKEWVNPISEVAPRLEGEFNDDNRKDYTAYESQGKLFWEFLLRANKYRSLSFVGDEDNKRTKRLILVEEYPNALLRNTAEFHSLLRRYNQISRCPAIFIVTDNISDLNARKLFPPELQEQLGITTINFNPATTSNLMNIISSIASVELSPVPPKQTLESIVQMCSGDIRLLINSLQFSYYNTETTPVTAKKKIKKDIVDGSKDLSLYLLYAVAKVLHCKRANDGQSDSSSLPDHLKSMGRLPLLSQPEDIVNNVAVSGECLTLFLHQNYLKFMADISEAVRASHYLSDSDTMLSEWTGKMTLEECASLVSVRGIMNSKASSVSSGWNPVHKPYWYTANKLRQERKLAMRNFSQNATLTNNDLLTEILPYSGLLSQTSWTKETISRYNELALSQSRSYRTKEEVLQQIDAMDIDEQSNEPTVPSVASEDSATIMNLPGDDDFTIEQYDSD